MIITDAQVHIWQAHSAERPWPQPGLPGQGFMAVPGARPHRAEPISAQEMIAMMDAAGVARAVIVPPSPAGDSNLCALEAAAQHPERFVVMGRFNPSATGARTALAGWRAQPQMVGIRMTFHQRQWSRWLDDGSIDWFWAECERLSIPLMLLMPGRLAEVGAIARRHPALRLIIDHLGLHSHHRDAQCEGDLQQLLALARHPRVAVKASAVPCYSTEAYPFTGFKPYLRQVYEAFGPRRMCWGSDVSRLPCSYRQAVAHFTEELDFLPANDLPWVMGRALSEMLGWPQPA